MRAELTPPPPEQLAVYQEVNRAELTEALDDFALARGVNLALDSQEGSLALSAAQPMPIVEGVTEAELREQGYADMRGSYTLLERLGQAQPGAEQPACTVCIPVAVLNGEDTAGTLHTLDLVRASQAKWGRDVNVVVWASAGYTQKEDAAAVRERAGAAYEALKTALEDKAGNGLHIRTALEVLPKDKPYLEILTINEAAMSRVRSHHMDAVSMLAAEEGYGFDHPVIWLDADTQYMSPDALEDLSTAVHHFDALMPHADVQFTTEWVGEAGLAAADDATKVVALNEIQHRQLRRIYGRLPEGAYTEECGTAFAVGVGLRAGGIDTSILFPKDEGAGLRRRILLRSYQAHQGEGVVPDSLLAFVRASASSGERADIPLQLLMRSVRIGSSGRGLRRAVQRAGVRALRSDYREGYTLYADAGAPAAAHPVSRAGVMELLGYNRALYPVADPESAMALRLQRGAHHIGQLVDRYFADPKQ